MKRKGQCQRQIYDRPFFNYGLKEIRLNKKHQSKKESKTRTFIKYGFYQINWGEISQWLSSNIIKK
jgi:hypothetical protein